MYSSIISSIFEAVKHVNMERVRVLSWTYYKLSYILSSLDLSEQRKLGTGPWVLFQCQVSFKILAFFYIKCLDLP